MSSNNLIQTERLILRPWRDSDRDAFAQLTADPRVMEFFPSTLTREESDQMIDKIQKKIDERGWGLWAVSVPGVSDFIGFIGLWEPIFEAHFTPAVEVGWRLAYPFWGKGYASEGARACLQYGFEQLGLNEIVSFTTEENVRSRKVMERIGMHRDPQDDFDHPKMDKEHPLNRHVLYRISQQEWKNQGNDNGNN